MISNMNIDCVVTYLDPTDKTWIDCFTSEIGIPPPRNHHNLDDQTQLFKYTIRGIANNMPFINKLHIIVFSKSQVPKWINLDEVDIITHDEFVEQRYLPVFNSSTYKVFYGNLPRVSDRFISLSDDYYLLNQFNKFEFFTIDGEPIFEKMYKKHFKDETQFNGHWNEIVKNCNRIAQKITGHKYDDFYGWYHYPHSYLKSYCKDILINGYDDLVSTITQFRQCDKNIEQLFWVICHYLKYRHTRNESIKNVLDESNCNSTNYIFPNILDLKKHGIKCLNLNYINPTDIDKIIDQFEKIYPEKSKYEL